MCSLAESSGGGFKETLINSTVTASSCKLRDHGALALLLAVGKLLAVIAVYQTGER